MTHSVHNSTSSSYPSPVYPLFYGGCVQVSTLIFTHPFDRLKTYQQTQVHYLGAMETIKKIVSSKGFSNLYSGFQYNAINGFFKGGIRWAILSTFEGIYKNAFSQEIKNNYPFFQPALLAITVASLETPWICAMEVFKTTEMTKNDLKIRSYKILKNEGFAALFKGGTTVLTRQIVSWGSFLLPLEMFTLIIKSQFEKDRLSSSDKFVVSMGASFFNVLCTNPLDVLKSKIQQVSSPYHSRSILKITVLVFSHEGFNAFFKGFKIRLISSQVHSTVSIYMMMVFGFYRSDA